MASFVTKRVMLTVSITTKTVTVAAPTPTTTVADGRIVRANWIVAVGTVVAGTIAVVNLLWSIFIYWKVRKQQKSREIEIENKDKIKAVEEKHAADYAKLKARVQALEFYPPRVERQESLGVEPQESPGVEPQPSPGVERQEARRLEPSEANGTGSGGLHRRQWTSTQE